MPDLGFGDMCKPLDNIQAILPASVIALIWELVMRGAGFPDTDFP